MSTADQYRLTLTKSRQLLELNEQTIPGGLASINRKADDIDATLAATDDVLRTLKQ